ncbi:ribosomal protein L34e superfamily protein [Tasmannia lanceolata]|uniref:ribosomal protein L34e superfamily protein n=1 Tax=Tasmannia lanceolata TaxID=3420 RepID=UPI004063C076
MVEYRSLISSCKSVDHRTNMANSVASTDQSAHPKQTHQLHRNKRQPTVSNPSKSPPCDNSRSAAVDVVILIAVLGACGFLIFPYAQLFCHGVAKIGGISFYAVKYEVGRAPIVYAFIGLSCLFTAIAVWGILHCTDRKCSNPNCLGLRKAAEFDIQLETEECLKNLGSSVTKGDTGRGFFELAEGHHRELEAELKKMAPPNGRAVLVFQARCGCPVGRMEVWGAKKLRKIKK